jgi:tetratricopeptide (TPR) repeat protein
MSLESRPLSSFLRPSTLVLLSFLAMPACNVNSSQNKFILADRLHEDKKYDAAINEYQDVVNKEPFSELGTKALQKIAETQHLYLGRMKEAQASYKLYLKRVKDESERQRTLRVLARLAFEEFEDYTEAIQLYMDLLAKGPTEIDAEEYEFQIGRALFLQSKFIESIESFEQLKQRHPNGKFLIRADLEIANAWSARGKCREAIVIYKKVTDTKDPQLTPLAKFAESACYEDLDDLDNAYELLESIKTSYPSPQVVELKMNKIKRRKILRKR